MSGFEHLTRRPAAGLARLVLVTVLLLGACAPDGGPVVVLSTYGVSVAETVSLEDGSDMLSESDAEMIRRRMAREPNTNRRPHAVALGTLGVGNRADPMQRPSEIVVSNFMPTSLRVNVICLLEGLQVPCSPGAGVWRVELDGTGLAILPVHEAEGRRDVLLLEENDKHWDRIRPVSRAWSLDGYDIPISTLGDPLPEIVNPLGGCNWALLMKDLGPRESFRPMGETSGHPVHLVISICPDSPSSNEMLPLVVVDETTVVQVVDAPFVARPGATYAWELPEELTETGAVIRGVVIRREPSEGFGGHVWVTHPLALSGVK